MNFDDEEHRVKRILDDESTHTPSDTKEKADSNNNESINTSNQHDDSISNSKDETEENKEIFLCDGDISEIPPIDDTKGHTKDDIQNSTKTDSNMNLDGDDEVENESTKENCSNNTSKEEEQKCEEDEVVNSDSEEKKSKSEEVGERFVPPSALGKKQQDEEEPMGLLDHLAELRRRLTRIVIIILIGFIGFYGVSELAYSYLALPLTIQLPEGSSLIYTSPQGAFFTYLKVSLMLSIIGTSPFTFYQIWAFIAPGLYKEEQSAVAPLAFFSALFFISGAAFCYFMVFPIAFNFFLGFTSDVVIPMISVEEYLSFALKLIIAFGLVFEMPLFSYFLAKLRIISPEAMRKHRKYAILAIFVVAAILTPPDVFSQVLMAIPMLVLYEVSICVAKVARGKAQKKETDKEVNDDTKEDIHGEINNFK